MSRLMRNFFFILLGANLLLAIVLLITRDMFGLVNAGMCGLIWWRLKAAKEV